MKSLEEMFGSMGQRRDVRIGKGIYIGLDDNTLISQCVERVERPLC